MLKRAEGRRIPAKLTAVGRGTARCLFMGTAASWLLAGCHSTQVVALHASELPPPGAPTVFHSGRLILEITPETLDEQCMAEGDLSKLCFGGVRSVLEEALSGVLKTSFPELVLADEEVQGTDSDYVLLVDLRLEALEPDWQNPGWSAGARGHYRLSRDGAALAGAGLASRSRGGFSYDEELGVGASEVVHAIAAHIGHVISTVPEAKPAPAVRLPPVVTRNGYIVAR